MELKRLQLRIGVKLGLFAALMCFAFFLVTYFLRDGVFGIVKLLDLWIPIFFMLLGIFFYRNKVNGGYLKFSEGFRIGATVTAMVTVVAPLLLLIFLTLIDSTYVQESFDAYRKAVIDNKETLVYEQGEVGYAKYLKFINEMEVSVFSVVLEKVMYYLGSGLLFSFLFSLFLRRLPR